MGVISSSEPAPVTEPPLAQRVVRGGLWVALSSYWMVGLGFVFNIILTRLLPSEAFGSYALANFFVQLVRLQSRFGLGYAFAQYQGEKESASSTYVIMDTVLAVSGLLLMILIAPLLAWLGYSQIVIQVAVVIAVAVMFEGLGGIGSILLEKELMFRPTSVVQGLAFTLSYLPAFWLATHNGGAWSLVSQGLVYNLLVFIGVGWAIGRYRLRRTKFILQYNREVAIEFIKYGITVGLGLLAATLVTQMDNFFIGTFIDEKTLGFYDRGYRTAQWPSLLLTPLLARTAFYTYARLQGDSIRLQKMLDMVLWMILLLAMPLGLALFVTAPDLLVFLYGERWLPSAPFLRLLALVSIVRPLWENAGALFFALGKPQQTLRLTAIQAIILATVGLPLTLIYGAVGTAVAVGVAFLGGLVLMYRNLHSQIPIAWRTTLGVPFLAGSLTLLGSLMLSSGGGLNAWPLWLRVVIKLLGTFGLFLLISFLLQPRTSKQRFQYIYNLLLYPIL